MKKFFLIKVLVIIVFLIVGYMICNLSQYYFPTTTYEKDEIRMVIDKDDVTKKLPEEALIHNSHPYISFNTVKKFFDKYIYFDKNYQTVIVTNDENVFKLKINDTSAMLNGDVKKLDAPVIKSGDVIYIPLKELENMYDIQVEYNEKIIISTKNTDYYTTKMYIKGKVKLYKKEFSGTVEKFLPNDVLTVFPSNENEEYVKVRTPNGSLGYVNAQKLENSEVIAKNEIKQIEKEPKRIINLTWEYAEFSTPDRSADSKMVGVNVISPTWIYMKNSTGEIKNTISKDYIAWAKSMGYELWPTVKNDNMELSETSALVTDMNARETFINNVVALAKQNGFTGVNIDFEKMNKEDINEFSQFIREFSAALRKNNIIASIDVTVPDGSEIWSLCYDRTALADCVDYIILMAYDQYGIAKDGPVASLAWVEANIKKMIEQEKVPNDKLVLGVPFYSKYRKNKETENEDSVISENISKQTLSMVNAKKLLNNSKYEDSIEWDADMGQYYIEYRKGNTVEKAWIEDENALAEKVKLVDEYQLAGVASWRKGFEAKEAWEVIRKNLKGL